MNLAKRLSSPLMCQNEVTSKKLKEEDGGGTKVDNYDFFFDEDDDIAMNDFCTAAEQAENTVKLDLSQWQRCVVETAQREKRTYDLILQVREGREIDKENEGMGSLGMAKCHLRGPWSHTRVDVGDIISLQCVWDDQLNAYKVDKDHGFCVTNPDMLIPSTSVVGAHFCRRKAVLQHYFKGIAPTNSVMVIGSLVHELMQIVLAKGLRSYYEISNTANQMLLSDETAYTLYASSLLRGEVFPEVQHFVPNILAFVQQYVEGREPAVREKDLFLGKITKIHDIEENLWVPQLGLKGKVDVSVCIQRRNNPLGLQSAKSNAIPLELKTGRATFSMEHKGQLLLYQMMLSAAGCEIKSGLLLYLRDGVMREVQSSRNEQRDLLGLRNELSHYLTREPNLPPVGTPLACGEGKFAQPLELPEPISHHSACSSCEYSQVCCTFARTDPQLQLREGHPLRQVMQEVTNHLQPEDYEYFVHWVGLLLLEEQDAKKSNYIRSLWTDTPEMRQREGRAIIGLRLGQQVVHDGTRYLHVFEIDPRAEEGRDLSLCGFSVGEYVIISTRKRIAVDAGFIHDVGKYTMSISAERVLHKNYAKELFIVDKHESQSGNAFNFTNLSLLVDNLERSDELRAIIVHRMQPTFQKELPCVVTKYGMTILKQLNAGQRAAVTKALTTDNFVLIKGLPGSGKTQTLVAVVRLLYLLGRSVLITSHTHSAVDNLLLRLKPYLLPMMRLGGKTRIHPQLRDCSETELIKNCRTELDFHEVYCSRSIVGVTCLATAHCMFRHRKFDYCIVDEATQVLQPTVLRPLLFCKRFVLVGDPHQLPPLIRSKEARSRGADESLFQRLDTEQATAVLTLQYRMNQTITKLANDLTYEGALKCTSKKVQNGTMKLELPPTADYGKWVRIALQNHIDQAVCFLDTKDCSERSYEFASAKHNKACAASEETFVNDPAAQFCPNVAEPSPRGQKIPKKKRISKYTNYCEAAIVFHLVKVLLTAGYKPDRIGIIAPYRAQVDLLTQIATQYNAFYEKNSRHMLGFSKVEVNTVDQYQGRDKDIILYSGSKTGLPASAFDAERSREAEILEDKRRLTVAITRSKFKLILVGDAACLEQYTPFRALLARIPSYSKLSLANGYQGFQWEALLEELSNVISV